MDLQSFDGRRLISGMSEEIRTSKAWADHCLGFLKEIHPDYTRNRAVKGHFIEFTREDESGLTISHNFSHEQNHYNYSFALLFSKRNTQMLEHCFLSGSRFDHNRTIWTLFRDFGMVRGDGRYPPGVWSSGTWYKNTLENLGPGMAIPDLHLLPLYRAELSAGKDRLIRLFTQAQDMMDQLPPGAGVEEFAAAFPQEMEAVERHPRELHSLTARCIARGGVKDYGYGPPTPGFDLDALPLEMIVASQAQVVLGERDRMGEISDIAKRL